MPQAPNSAITCLHVQSAGRPSKRFDEKWKGAPANTHESVPGGAARQLRYAALPEAAIDRVRIEALKADLSSAQYLIELLAPARLVASGDHLRRAVLDYVDDAPTANPAELELLRRRAGLEVEHFTLLAKADLP